MVGDGAVGKTSLAITHTTGEFPSMYVPTVFDNYVVENVIDNTRVEWAIWDCAGGVRQQTDYMLYSISELFSACVGVES